MASTTSPTSTNARALLSSINRCIEAAADAQKGYAVAAADVRDGALKTLFQLRSDERAAFVVALQRAVSELGGWPENQGTVEGALHRAWMEARLAVEGRLDRTVLLECERGERAGLKVYEAALWLASSNPDVPQRVRETIGSQLAAIRDALEDLAKRLTHAS
ncbi:MAG TPA: PA2169 family four-helix-bundle protein [Labilithrix sp.]|nr:PA2169 family four-helix-bundle protein [Labilithrix sp.]